MDTTPIKSWIWICHNPKKPGIIIALNGTLMFPTAKEQMRKYLNLQSEKEFDEKGFKVDWLEVSYNTPLIDEVWWLKPS